MRHSLSTAVAVALVMPVPLAAARTEATSWGKSGISIDQYRTDATTCGRAGYYADVSGTEAAQVFKRASRDLEANETDLPLIAMDASPNKMASLMTVVTRSADIVESTRPAERMRDVGAFQQGKVDDCLKSRGYIRFRLTTGQRKRLAHLHLGSPERHFYLYTLATDPAVLKAQAM